MYRIIKVDKFFIDDYFKNIGKDLGYFDLDYNKKMLNRNPYFLFKLEKKYNNEILTVGLFGMFQITRDTAKTLLLHLKDSERGNGIGYFLQYLRLYLTKVYFPTVKKIVTMCDKNSKRAIRLYDKIYRIHEKNISRKIIIGKYIKYDCLLKKLLSKDNNIINFIEKDDNSIIRDIETKKEKFIDLFVLNENKNS